MWWREAERSCRHAADHRLTYGLGGELGKGVGGLVGFHHHFFGKFFVAVGFVAEGVGAGLEIEEGKHAVPFLVGEIRLNVHPAFVVEIHHALINRLPLVGGAFAIGVAWVVHHFGGRFKCAGYVAHLLGFAPEIGANAAIIADALQSAIVTVEQALALGVVGMERALHQETRSTEFEHGIIAVHPDAVGRARRCAAHPRDVAHHSRLIDGVMAPHRERVVEHVGPHHPCHRIGIFEIGFARFATEEHHQIVHLTAIFVGIAMHGEKIVGLDGIHLASDSLQRHNLLLTGAIVVGFHPVESRVHLIFRRHGMALLVFVEQPFFHLCLRHIARFRATHDHFRTVAQQVGAGFERLPKVGARFVKTQRVHHLVVDGGGRSVAGGVAAVPGIQVNGFAFQPFSPSTHHTHADQHYQHKFLHHKW